MKSNLSSEEINSNICALEKLVKSVLSHSMLPMGVDSDGMSDDSSARVNPNCILTRISDKECLHSEDVDCGTLNNS